MRITQALKDQDAIGWHSALKGYLSIEWRYLFTLGIGDDEELPEGIGMHRFRTVVQSLTTFATEVWKSRNQVLHGKQEDSGFKIRQEEVAEIQHLYMHPEKVSASDRHYCEKPLEAILRRSPSSRRRWLRYMRMARARLTRDGQRQMLIMAYFRGAQEPRTRDGHETV